MKNTFVLFYPKTEPENINKNIPFSLLKIGSELKGRGFDVMIIDERREKNYEPGLRCALDRSIGFGVSSMTGYQISGGLKASSFVKQTRPDMPVIWGGWHPSLLPAETLKNPAVDVVVIGQGEKTICELASALKEGIGFGGIQGIAYKKDGNIVRNSDRAFCDLNDFASINFDILDIKRYISSGPLGESSIFWNSSQGCPYCCGFCSTPTVYNRRWSGLNAVALLGQIEYLVRAYGVDSVTFAEDNFFVDVERIERFCRGLVEKGLGVKWAADIRVDQINRFSESFLNLLKKSGCSKLYIGAESGDAKVLKLIDKKISPRDIYRSAEILDKCGIISEFFIIVGFPQNPDTDLANTLLLIKEIKSKYPNHQFTPFLYTPYPGTPLLKLSMEKGVKLPAGLEGWVNWSILSVSTPWVNLKYLDKINMYAKFYYPLAYPSDSLRNKFKSGFFMLPYFVLHLLSKFRLATGLFMFPAEWRLVKLFYWIKIKLKIFKNMESFR